MSADRCDGRCCRGFTLPYSPEELARSAGTIVDGAFILDMVRPVGRDELGEYLYDCRHLAPSGDCAVYAHRPAMCADFPYGRPCPLGEACASPDAREGRVDRPRRLPLVGVGGRSRGAEPCDVHPRPPDSYAQIREAIGGDVQQVGTFDAEGGREGGA